MACSSESKEGFGASADWTCTLLNVARTCGSFDFEGGSCTGLNSYPNVPIYDYGSISGVSAMQIEPPARPNRLWHRCHAVAELGDQESFPRQEVALITSFHS